jgi:hypothetical protein
MAVKKSSKRKIKNQATIKENNDPYVPGDFCYYVTRQESKPKFAEVISISIIDDRPVYTVLEQSDQKYVVVPHENCSDSESVAKKIKAALKNKL